LRSFISDHHVGLVYSKNEIVPIDGAKLLGQFSSLVTCESANKEQSDTRACRSWPAGDSSDAKVNSYVRADNCMDLVMSLFVISTC
jgi:hypothetical protein